MTGAVVRLIAFFPAAQRLDGDFETFVVIG
jgi:hypothetical protein